METVKIVKVNPGEKARIVEIFKDLKSYQNAVGGGCIEAIYPFNDEACLICNDEGKINGMEPNRILRDEKGNYLEDIICGPFFIIGIDRDDFVSLTTEQAEKYMKIFEKPEKFFKECEEENGYANIWECYLEYLRNWVKNHDDEFYAGMSPAGFNEWLDNEE